jgi:uncharacterized MnhB-related membrane protein
MSKESKYQIITVMLVLVIFAVMVIKRNDFEYIIFQGIPELVALTLLLLLSRSKRVKK